MSERGDFTLTGLLVAMALMLVVIGATFSVFGTAETVQRKTELTQDAQQAARNAVDRMTIELRNLASPVNDAPLAISGVTGSDIVFQTVDKSKPTGSLNVWNIKRVRYCLDGNGVLWRAEQKWQGTTPPDVPTAAGGGCPGSWTSPVRVVSGVTNGARPLFRVNSTDTTKITDVDVDLFVRVDRKRQLGETELSSGVFLRNQNRMPTAAIDVVAVNAQGITLSAASSADPEGDNLTYEWTDLTRSRKIGSSIVLLYPGSELQKGQTYDIQLKVTDGGGLSSTTHRKVTWGGF
jgi:type II secretory pathway pseudopilin PulG